MKKRNKRTHTHTQRTHATRQTLANLRKETHTQRTQHPINNLLSVVVFFTFPHTFMLSQPALYRYVGERPRTFFLPPFLSHPKTVHSPNLMAVVRYDPSYRFNESLLYNIRFDLAIAHVMHTSRTMCTAHTHTHTHAKPTKSSQDTEENGRAFVWKRYCYKCSSHTTQ